MHSSQSNIVKELHERQDMSDRAKGDLVTIEAKLQETEAKKQTVCLIETIQFSKLTVFIYLFFIDH